MRQVIGVLTGDIVHSRRLGVEELDAVMTVLAEAAERIGSWQQASAPPLERYRGDGWQYALMEPRYALRAALMLRAAVRACHPTADTRIAIGFGTARLEHGLASAAGTAFESSGHALERLQGTRRMGMDWAGHENDPLFLLGRGLVRLCDGIGRNWTRRQADILVWRVLPDRLTMQHIADQLGVAQQTVQAHLQSALGEPLMDACSDFEKAWDIMADDHRDAFQSWQSK